MENTRWCYRGRPAAETWPSAIRHNTDWFRTSAYLPSSASSHQPGNFGGDSRNETDLRKTKRIPNSALCTALRNPRIWNHYLSTVCVFRETPEPLVCFLPHRVFSHLCLQHAVSPNWGLSLPICLSWEGEKIQCPLWNALFHVHFAVPPSTHRKRNTRTTLFRDQLWDLFVWTISTPSLIHIQEDFQQKVVSAGNYFSRNTHITSAENNNYHCDYTIHK